MEPNRNFTDLTQSLSDSFNALADEVQTLADRRIILEHKLRFAHEQFQYLADKYAPAASEVAETLTKLQLPSRYPLDSTSPVPLPGRRTPQSEHELALIIRDGRRKASKLVSLGDASKTTGSSRRTFSITSNRDQTSLSTALELDFTVEGKKGDLRCPFQQPQDAGDVEAAAKSSNVTHDPPDPICAAMYEGSTVPSAGPNGTTASRCPIRYLDKHSSQEVAQYIEAHKHELPRSHEVCLRRYQGEDQVRKIDTKYGDIVSMIEGLSQLHKPMLPSDQNAGDVEGNGDQDEEDPDQQVSHDRVHTWAKDVTGNTDLEVEPQVGQTTTFTEDETRQSHFDRPLKEVRVGESPSRPWGISVPIYETAGPDNHLPLSPPPAPVRMQDHPEKSAVPSKPAGKCPFDHKALAAMGLAPPHPHSSNSKSGEPGSPRMHASVQHEALPPPLSEHRAGNPKAEADMSKSHQPTFVNPDATPNAGPSGQMVFTGPVFIGYPMDQALEFMNRYQGPKP